jgi:PadR family transcriptional regulator, regulatory protein PadR
MPDTMPVMKGTLDLLVLKALTWAPMHGFEISEWLERHSHRILELEEAALYQALYRMEGRRLVKAEWGLTENRRRARYYSITSRGEKELQLQSRQWMRYADTMATILTLVPGKAR